MKCVECVEYAECSKKHNLTIKRKHCPMARVEYVQTNADRIRAMTDEELASHLYLFAGLEEQIKFCQNIPECEALICADEGIPEEKCIGCLLKWLQQPAEEVNDECSK